MFSTKNFCFIFLKLWREIQYVLLRTVPLFSAGGKNTNRLCPGQFLPPFLSTFHSAIIHI